MEAIYIFGLKFKRAFRESVHLGRVHFGRFLCSRFINSRLLIIKLMGSSRRKRQLVYAYYLGELLQEGPETPEELRACRRRITHIIIRQLLELIISLKT